MTNEQINIAIAESLGWRNVRKDAPHNKPWDAPLGNSPQSTYKGLGFERIPNYAADLNAMREAKNALTDGQKRKWGEVAVSITPKQDVVLYCKNSVSGENIFTLANLDAKQEAEIYLRTIEKWKGGEQ